MKEMLAYTLCNSKGELLCSDVEEAKVKFGAMSGLKLMELFKEIEKANGLDVEEEVKNLAVVQ